jgi:hypothetical protein
LVESLIICVNFDTYINCFIFALITNVAYIAARPIVKDENLKIELVTGGLTKLTSMAIIDRNNILILEKNNGTARLVTDRKLQIRPVLNLLVNATDERGLLEIATNADTMRGSPNSSGGPKFSKQKLVNVFLFLTEGISGTGLRNVVYKFRWDTTNLVKPSLILDLPGLPGPDHNSGKLLIGPNCYLYAVIGKLQHNSSHARFQWGWKKVVGPISRSNLTYDELVNLPASKYSNPVLSWKQPAGVTQIEFLKSSKLGHKYEYNILLETTPMELCITLRLMQVGQD